MSEIDLAACVLFLSVYRRGSCSREKIALKLNPSDVGRYVNVTQLFPAVSGTLAAAAMQLLCFVASVWACLNQASNNYLMSA